MTSALASRRGKKKRNPGRTSPRSAATTHSCTRSSTTSSTLSSFSRSFSPRFPFPFPFSLAPLPAPAEVSTNKLLSSANARFISLKCSSSACCCFFDPVLAPAESASEEPKGKYGLACVNNARSILRAGPAEDDEEEASSRVKSSREMERTEETVPRWCVGPDKVEATEVGVKAVGAESRKEERRVGCRRERRVG